jgi:DNA-directed RNA polymerase sigma subunit (sigma70/sigma32)
MSVLSPLGSYFQELDRRKLFSPEELNRLVRRAKRGDVQVRNRVIECNLRLVVNIARRYTNRGLEFDDLVGYGNEGLFRAVELFPTLAKDSLQYLRKPLDQAID